MSFADSICEQNTPPLKSSTLSACRSNVYVFVPVEHRTPKQVSIHQVQFFFKSFLKNLAYLPLCCPVQMEGLAFRMYYHQIVRIDIYPCAKKQQHNSEKKRPHTLACSKLSVSEHDRKSGRVTSGISDFWPVLFTPRSRSPPARFFYRPHWPKAWNRLHTHGSQKQSGRLNTKDQLKGKRAFK